ncbi:MAG: hypothetical protein PHV18_11505 [Lachnospiraceae bacterium]|nr:hypothetical protein [Lachnospiraceae bacterium]
MKRNRDGSAMIVVMCVMLMTMALSLALLLTSSVMISNANRANAKEQCRINAVSVANVLTKTIPTYSYDGVTEEYPTGRDSSLKGKLKSVLTTEWYPYDRNASSLQQILRAGKDYYSYKLGTDSGLPGETVVDLYFGNEQEEEEPDKKTNQDEWAEYFMGIILYVKVTSTVGNESSTVISKFQPDIPDRTTLAGWKWQYQGRYWEGGISE